MRRFVIAAAITVSLGAGPAPAAPPKPTAATATSARVPPLAYRSRTLANGLRVFAIRDTSSPNVAVQVWYDVGSKDDPRGRSGFAHLFEHLMFKATRNLAPEQFDRLTEDVGGFNNASTADDYTNYYEVVPANHLERILWAEAERMGSLAVEQDYFESERDVVKEELRSRVLAQPYGKLFYLYLPQVSYARHPYARPGIGSIEDLDSATIDDVRAFHATYYRPDNAVLVVAGNFDPARLDRLVDEYFAPIARPKTAIPRVKVAEPPRTRARRFTVYEPNTPLPAVAISFPAPPAASRDTAALELAAAILSRGRSSRFYNGLVRGRIATDADLFLDIKQGPGVVAAYAILASGKTAAEGEAALRAEIARLRDTRVSAAELAEARNELLTDALRERETVGGKADTLAEAVIMAGDPRAADRRLAELARVTPADIQRVARQWLADQRSAAVRYLPEQPGAKGDRIATAPTVVTVPLAAPAGIRTVSLAPEAERVAPPPPAAPVSVAVPSPNVQRLANGLTVVTVERRDLPLVSAALVSPRGSSFDPAGKAGLARMAATLMTRGTATRSATEIAQAVEALGGSIGAGADHDGANVSLGVKSDQLAPALALLADVARNPVFAADEIERQRALATDELEVALKNPAAIAGFAAARALYGAGAYGHAPDGTPQSLKAIGRDDLVAAWRSAFTPATTTLVIAGDIDPARARALAERQLGDWTATAEVAAEPAPAASSPTRGRLVVIDMPGSGQAAVTVARESIARSDPAFYRALVANAVLGTGYSARLNQEIRIKRGLAYGARSAIDARRRPGPFLASTQTKNESAAEVLGLILAEMRRLGAEPVPPAELAARKEVLKGNFTRQLETTAGLAALVGEHVLLGVPFDELGRYQGAIAAVSDADARAAARSLIVPDGATMVIVGDSAKFLPALKQAGYDPVTVKLGELKLDRPDLR